MDVLLNHFVILNVFANYCKFKVLSGLPVSTWPHDLAVLYWIRILQLIDSFRSGGVVIPTLCTSLKCAGISVQFRCSKHSFSSESARRQRVVGQSLYFFYVLQEIDGSVLYV